MNTKVMSNGGHFLNVVLVSTSNDIITRILKTKSNFKNISVYSSYSEALPRIDKRTVLIMEQPEYQRHICQSFIPVIILTERHFDLHGGNILYIPKELYFTDYLSEFIVWAYWSLMEKLQISKSKEVIVDLEDLLEELKIVSKESVL